MGMFHEPPATICLQSAESFAENFTYVPGTVPTLGSYHDSFFPLISPTVSTRREIPVRTLPHQMLIIYLGEMPF